MTVPRLQALYKHWKDNPPLQAMVAAWLGIKKPESRKISQNEFMRMVGGRANIIKVKPDGG